MIIPLLISLLLNFSGLHFNAGRGYDPFAHATREGVLLSNSTSSPLTDSIILSEPVTSATLSFRIANRHAHPSRNYSYLLPDGKEKTVKNPTWSLFIDDSTGNRLTMTLSNKESEGPISSESYTSLLLSLSSGSQTTGISSELKDEAAGCPAYTPSETLIEAGCLPFHGETLWTITLSATGISIVAGAREPNRILTVTNPLADISSFGFTAAPGGEILLSDISLHYGRDREATYAPESIASVLADNNDSTTLGGSQDPVEGYWQIFDRNLEESLLRLGGEYKLAIVKDHDRYAIVYLAGARVNAEQWQPGMVKGWLTPTPFPGLFDLEWLDAEGEPMSHSVTAQLTEEGVLTIQFPYQSSVIRLRKL